MPCMTYTLPLCLLSAKDVVPALLHAATMKMTKGRPHIDSQVMAKQELTAKQCLLRQTTQNTVKSKRMPAKQQNPVECLHSVTRSQCLSPERQILMKSSSLCTRNTGESVPTGKMSLSMRRALVRPFVPSALGDCADIERLNRAVKTKFSLAWALSLPILSGV